jgi:hypothetical protein
VDNGENRQFSTTRLTVTEREALTEEVVAPKENRRLWLWMLPGCGCAFVIAILLAGVAALFITGKFGTDLEIAGLPRIGNKASPTATAGPAPTSTATPDPSRPLTLTVEKLARIQTDGTRDPVAAVLFTVDNRGIAAEVTFGNVIKGQSGQVAAIWERIEGNTLIPVRPPDMFTYNDTFTDTTWWYAFRSDNGLPAGQYQFTAAIVAPDKSLNRQSSMRFEVRAR